MSEFNLRLKALLVAATEQARAPSRQVASDCAVAVGLLVRFDILCELLHKRDFEADSGIHSQAPFPLSELSRGDRAAGPQDHLSDELAQLGGTTSAQVRKDLSLFGSFGKRGLGYSVPELSEKLRQILGLGKQWRVCIIGAGKIGAALARYRGFAERGFNVTAVYDIDEGKIGKKWETLTVRPISELGARRGEAGVRYRCPRDSR